MGKDLRLPTDFLEREIEACAPFEGRTAGRESHFGPQEQPTDGIRLVGHVHPGEASPGRALAICVEVQAGCCCLCLHIIGIGDGQIHAGAETKAQCPAFSGYIEVIGRLPSKVDQAHDPAVEAHIDGVPLLGVVFKRDGSVAGADTRRECSVACSDRRAQCQRRIDEPAIVIASTVSVPPVIVLSRTSRFCVKSDKPPNSVASTKILPMS